jgi:hypothetical protein
MIGINKKNARPVLAAVAALALGVSSQYAKADNLVYSTGFEPSPASPAFATGAVTTQGGFVQDYSGTAGSTANVVASPSPVEGTQSLEISHAVGETTETIGVAPHTLISQAAPFTVTSQVDINYTPTGAADTNDGPFFGLNLYGNNGTLFIGSFGIDGTTGDLVDDTHGPGAFNLGSSGFGIGAYSADPWSTSGNAFETFKIVATFLGGDGDAVELDDYLNGVEVDSNTTSVDVNSFDYAYLYGSADDLTDTAGNAYFDNYSITTTAAVPEPASLALVGLAGALLCTRRSRVNRIAGL